MRGGAAELAWHWNQYSLDLSDAAPQAHSWNALGVENPVRSVEAGRFTARASTDSQQLRDIITHSSWGDIFVIRTLACAFEPCVPEGLPASLELTR